MSNKEEITQREIEDIEKEAKKNTIYQFLENREAYDFNVGDIIVKLTAHWPDGGHYDPTRATWKPETVSYANSAPKRYKVVYKDKHNICYFKPMLLNGNLGKQIFGTHSIDNRYAKYKVDDEYATLAIVGAEAEFDAVEKAKTNKEAREKARRENRDKVIKFKDSADCQAWFDTLKVGDTFYGHYGRTSTVWAVNKEENFTYTVMVIEDFPNTGADPNKLYSKYTGLNSWGTSYKQLIYDEHARKNGSPINTRTFMISLKNGNTETLYEKMLYGPLKNFVIYSSKPQSINKT